MVVYKNDIEFWRTYYGLSQRQLAERAGLNSSGISCIERGERVPGVYTAQHIARALNKSVDEIFWEETNG